MKANDFSTLLTHLAKMYEMANAVKAQRALESLASVWNIGGSTKIYDAIPIMAADIKISTTGPFAEKVDLLIDIIDATIAFTKPLATAPKRKPLTAFKDFLLPYRKMDLHAFLDQMRQALREPEDIVDYYVVRLERAYQDSDQFKPLYERLKSDKRVRAAEAKKIAERFTRYSKSKNKTEAFDAIMRKHRNFADAVSAGRAMGGKSAA